MLSFRPATDVAALRGEIDAGRNPKDAKVMLAREIAALRMRVNDLATRDFIRSELRDLLAELEENRGEDSPSERG